MLTEQPLSNSIGQITHYSRTPRLGKFTETLMVYAHGAASVFIANLDDGRLLFHGHWKAGTSEAAAIAEKGRTIDAEREKAEQWC